MSTIDFGSKVGFIEYKSNASGPFDQFVCTSKLIEDWTNIFSGRQLPLEINTRLKIKIVGKRDRYVKPGSFQPVASMVNLRTLR